MACMITEIRNFSTPTECSDEPIKSQFTLSDAFSRSNLIDIQSLFLCFLRMQWITSYTIIILSDILRLAIKSTCSYEIRLGKIILNLFALTFIINLYNTKHSLIGRNWLRCSWLSFLGIRTIKVLFNSESMRLPLNIPFTYSQTAGPIISHWLWKKCAWYPSIPNAFNRAISKSNFLISSLVTPFFKK